MEAMFHNARSFNFVISSWDVSAANTGWMFLDSGCSSSCHGCSGCPGCLKTRCCLCDPFLPTISQAPHTNGASSTVKVLVGLSTTAILLTMFFYICRNQKTEKGPTSESPTKTIVEILSEPQNNDASTLNDPMQQITRDRAKGTAYVLTCGFLFYEILSDILAFQRHQ